MKPNDSLYQKIANSSAAVRHRVNGKFPIFGARVWGIEATQRKQFPLSRYNVEGLVGRVHEFSSVGTLEKELGMCGCVLQPGGENE